MLTDLTARQLREKIVKGEVSSREATQTLLAAIDRHNPALHAYNEVYHERALQRADSVDAARKAGQPLGALAGASNEMVLSPWNGSGTNLVFGTANANPNGTYSGGITGCYRYS